MSLAALIRNMAAAGASPEAIALAVEAIEAAEAKVEAQKVAARERKRKQRAGQSRDSHGTITGPGGDSHAETPSLAPSPQTPHPHTHTRECASTRGREAADGFERFWAEYPLKKAKDAARKAYPRASRRASLETMLAAIARQRRWDQWQRGIIPHAATWLNQSRWDDEDPPEPEAPSPRHERPHHDPKFTARQANHAAAFEGAQRAAGRDWEP